MSYAKSPIFSGGYGLPVSAFKTVVTRETTKRVETIGIRDIDGELVPVKNVISKTRILTYSIKKKGRIDPHDHVARRKKGGTLMYDNTRTFTNSAVIDGKVKKKIQGRFTA